VQGWSSPNTRRRAARASFRIKDLEAGRNVVHGPPLNMADDDKAPAVKADSRVEDEQPKPRVKNREVGAQPVAAPPVSPFKIKDLEAGRNVLHHPPFNMADDDKARAVKADARLEDEQPKRRVKNGGVGTQPVAAPPVSPFRIKDLEAGRNVLHGPPFNIADDVKAPAVKVAAPPVSPFKIKDLEAGRNVVHGAPLLKIQSTMFSPSVSALLFHQQNEEPTEIPFVDNVGLLIPETQIRNEQRFDDLQH
jgi:hypothetical protein